VSTDAITSPTRFMYISEGVRGAVAHNERTRRLRSLRDQNRSSFGLLKLHLTDLLQAGRMISTGNPDSSLSPSFILSPSAWKYLKLTDLKGSVVTEQSKTKRQIFDVRIFPVLEAPNAIDLLAGRTLSNVFQAFIVEDPQVVSTLKRACKIEGTRLSGFQRVPIAGPADRIADVIDAITSEGHKPRSRRAVIRLLESRILRLQSPK
jgi:hypothetical protein